MKLLKDTLRKFSLAAEDVITPFLEMSFNSWMIVLGAAIIEISVITLFIMSWYRV